MATVFDEAHRLNGHPYLEFITDIDQFGLWRVDGGWIRKELEPNFTDFGEHYDFPKLIPQTEFWVDREILPRELPFFVDHMLMEYWQCYKGTPFDKALEMADRFERAERMRSGAGVMIPPFDARPDDPIRERVLGHSTDTVVWLVNGENVRRDLFPDFVEGGHDIVYSFIPHGEVWIDDDSLFDDELSYVIIHELFERHLMTLGATYLEAHAEATKVEQWLRNHPQYVWKALEDSVHFVWTMDSFGGRAEKEVPEANDAEPA